MHLEAHSSRHVFCTRYGHGMDFALMAERAAVVRARYAEWEAAQHGRSWTTEEIALGLVGDVGDLMKLVQGKAGVRPRADLDEALAHELADCLWAVMTLAAAYGVDLEAAFLVTMDRLEQSLTSDAHRAPRPPRPGVPPLAQLLRERGPDCRRSSGYSPAPRPDDGTVYPVTADAK